MANAQEPVESRVDDDGFHMGSLLRMGSWGIGAAAALFLAVLAGLSDPGATRVDGAVAAISGHMQTVVATPVPVKPTVTEVTDSQQSVETRRLAEQVRLLAADRDRLLHRLTVVERNVEDITGSIKRQASAPVSEAKAQTVSALAMPPPWPATPQVAAPWSMPSAASAPPVDSRPQEASASPLASKFGTKLGSEPGSKEAEANSTGSVNAEPPATTSVPRLPPQQEREEAQKQPEPPEVKRAAEPAKPPAQKHQLQQHAALPTKPQPTTGRVTYGIDLGGAVSVDRLRMLWNAVRSSQTQTGILNGLHPIASVRETKTGGRPEIRLVVGPLPTEASANRLCSALLDSGRYCEPTVYRGQRIIKR